MILKILTGKLIIRMYYGDSQDGLQIYSDTNNYVNSASFVWWTSDRDWETKLEELT